MKVKIYLFKGLIVLLFLLCVPALSAQVALKTNALYGGLSQTPNVSAEFFLNPSLTLDATVGFNPFTFNDGKKWKHLLLQPGLRFWSCEAFNGFFWGVHAHWAAFNLAKGLPLGIEPVNLKNNRFEGQLAGAGASVGYQWPLSKHWSLEAEAGLGYVYIWYDQYRCDHCGDFVKDGDRNYVGPTKAVLNIVYVF